MHRQTSVSMSCCWFAKEGKVFYPETLAKHLKIGDDGKRSICRYTKKPLPVGLQVYQSSGMRRLPSIQRRLCPFHHCFVGYGSMTYNVSPCPLWLRFCQFRFGSSMANTGSACARTTSTCRTADTSIAENQLRVRRGGHRELSGPWFVAVFTLQALQISLGERQWIEPPVCSLSASQ